MTATTTGSLTVISSESQPRNYIRRNDCLPPGAVQRAVLLVGAVHDEGPDEVDMLLRRLTRDDLYAITVTLAAMVPADYTPAELLAWNDAQFLKPAPTPLPDAQAPLFPAVLLTRQLKPHGTHAAFNRHKQRGEEPCDACRFGETQFQAMRPRRERPKKTENDTDEAATC